MGAELVRLPEVLEDFEDEGEIGVDPEVLAPEVTQQQTVHLGAEAWELGVGAHHLGAAVQSEAARGTPVLLSRQPVLLQVVVELGENGALKKFIMAHRFHYFLSTLLKSRTTLHPLLRCCEQFHLRKE